MDFITLIRNSNGSYSLTTEKPSNELQAKAVIGTRGRLLLNHDSCGKALKRTYSKFPWMNKPFITFSSEEEKTEVIDWLSQIELYKKDSVWNSYLVTSTKKPETREELIDFYKKRLNDEYDYKFPEFGKIHTRTKIEVHCKLHGLICSKSIGYLVENRYSECESCLNMDIDMTDAYTSTGRLSRKATNLQRRKHYLSILNTNFNYKFDMSEKITDKTKIDYSCKKHPQFKGTKTLKQLLASQLECNECKAFDVEAFFANTKVNNEPLTISQQGLEEFKEDVIAEAIMNMNLGITPEMPETHVDTSATDKNEQRKALIREQKAKLDSGEVTLSWTNLEECNRITQEIRDAAGDTTAEYGYITLSTSGKITLEWEQKKGLAQSEAIRFPELAYDLLKKVEAYVAKANLLPKEYKEMVVKETTLNKIQGRVK